MTQECNPMDGLVELDGIAGPAFGVSAKVARRKAAAKELPVPAFRLTTTGRGPYFVRCADLAAYIAAQAAAATNLHHRRAAKV